MKSRIDGTEYQPVARRSIAFVAVVTAITLALAAAPSQAGTERDITHSNGMSGEMPTDSGARTPVGPDRSGELIVQTHCSKCHQTGVDGAPRIGDRAAWIPRARDGFDALTRAAINGHGHMPARGGLANLTDGEIRAAIAYMLYPVRVGVMAPVTARPKEDPNHRIVDGTEIHFGVISAESLRKQHSGRDPESTMHKGIPSGSGYYHLNVSLHDAKTGSPINDAQVEVRIADPVRGDQVKVLEPMVMNNNMSYGNYVRLAGHDLHTIAVLIRKPGDYRAIQTKFEFRE
jgi:cytochrome c5